MYILCALENHLSGAELDFEATGATLEHILPENPGPGWEDFSEEDRERFTYRLGNYTLLERHLNREAANRDFQAKREIYARSRFQMNREIAYEEWTPEAVKKRQQRLASLAAAVWRLDY